MSQDMAARSSDTSISPVAALSDEPRHLDAVLGESDNEAGASESASPDDKNLFSNDIAHNDDLESPRTDNRAGHGEESPAAGASRIGQANNRSAAGARESSSQRRAALTGAVAAIQFFLADSAVTETEPGTM